MSTTYPNPLFYSVIVLVLLFNLTACDSTDKTSSPPPTPTISSTENTIVLSELDRQLLEIASNLKLTGDPTQGHVYPPANDSLTQLGKQLFFQPYTTQGSTFTCAQCHDPLQGGTTRQALATGLTSPQPSETVPDYLFHRGRTVLPVRNAPTTFNTSLWNKRLFHDGRIQALQPQAGENGTKGGIQTPYSALNQPDPEAGRNLVQAAAQLNLLRRSYFTQAVSPDEPLPSMGTWVISDYLNGDNPRLSVPNQPWLNLFRQGFNKPDGLAVTLITPSKIAEALASYMRSQVFINNPWKHYLEGDPQAISETAKQGALLFFRNAQQGGFDCVRCHSGDTFTDENLYRTLMPPIHLQRPFRVAPEEMDYGRWFITQEEQDKFSFRTPSLLNVTETGPWGHNGAYLTLSSIVRHMLDPVTEASQYDLSSLSSQGLAADQFTQGINTMLAQGIDLTSQKYSQKELQALLAFLHTLTDPCIKDPVCLKPWLPN